VRGFLQGCNARAVANERQVRPPGVPGRPGYWRGEQMQRIGDHGIQVLIPPDTSRRRSTRRNRDGGPYHEMRHVLAGDDGSELYRKRQR
jgi:hypothetical protein